MTYQAASERAGEVEQTGLRSCERPSATGWRRVFDWFHKQDAADEVGPYQLVEKIGQGGMGVVYKATHPSAPRPVALKLLRGKHSKRKDVERFEREARVTSLLHHPNTISVYDSGRTPDGAPYFVMEYVEGPDLQTLVQDHGPLTPARVARILAQLAGALAEVHRLGLVHGDIKPANVVLCAGSSDRVKILDFGLAREFDRGGARAGAQHIAGTPLYLSPEILLGKPVDGRSDLYALGVLAYFLLTGAPPFTGKTALEVCFQHLDRSPAPLSERCAATIPAGLEALISSCLEKTPEQRPNSADAVRQSALAIASAAAH